MPTKRNSFLKRAICKTRSLKPDYRPTMTQSLMFIPVIRCEEADLYFIVVECIAAASRLLQCLPASLGNIFLLLRPGVIPAWRKQRCLQPTAIMIHILWLMPPEGKFLQSSIKLSPRSDRLYRGVCVCACVCVGFLPDCSPCLLAWVGLHWIALIVCND